MSIEASITEANNWFVGEDIVFKFSIFQADNVTPQDITNWALEWVLRKAKSATAAILTKTTGGSGIVITNPTGGICEVTVTDDDTLALLPGTYYHTLRRTDAGSERVLSFGDAVLRHAATR